MKLKVTLFFIVLLTFSMNVLVYAANIATPNSAMTTDEEYIEEKDNLEDSTTELEYKNSELNTRDERSTEEINVTDLEVPFLESEEEINIENIGISSAGGETMDVSHLLKTRSYMSFEGGVLKYTDSLTASDNSDFYFFSTAQSRLMLFKIISYNSNYVIDLGRVDWNTGVITFENVQTSGSDIKPYFVSAGDWVLYVHSKDGSLGDSYSIMCNVTNPSSVQQIVYYTNDLTTVVIRTTPHNYYYNGKFVPTSSVYTKEVKWELSEEYPIYDASNPTVPGSGHRYMNISEGQVKSINYGSFVTDRMSIPNALWVELDVGTMWTYNRSEIVGGSHTYIQKDIRGLDTPRFFDSIDVEGEDWGRHYLIYNLDSEQYVNMYSVFNPYFYTGGEKLQRSSWMLRLE